MEQEIILKKLEEIEKKLEENSKEIKKMSRFFLWTIVVSVAVVVLPLLGLLAIIPQFLDLYGSMAL